MAIETTCEQTRTTPITWIELDVLEEMGTVSTLLVRAAVRFHDLVLFCGTDGQAGPYRHISKILGLNNDLTDVPFQQVEQTAARVATLYKLRVPDGKVLGIGTSFKHAWDIPNLLKTYDFCFTGGVPLQIGQSGMDFGVARSAFHVLGNDNAVIQIPLSLLRGSVILPDPMSSLNPQLG